MKKWNFAKIAQAAVLSIFVMVSIAYAATYDLWTVTGSGSRRNTVEFKIQASAPGSAASLLPGTDATNDLGSSSYRFNNSYVVTANSTNVVTSTATFNVRLNSAPRTNVTPTRAGELVFNTTANELCMSTGSVASSWVKVSTPSAACAN